MITHQPSCADIFESGLLPVDQALKQILSELPTLTSAEYINIETAKGRTLAQSIIAPFDVPSHHNSAVDGYALNSNDLPEQGLVSIDIIGSAFAGKPFTQAIKPGQCLRIMTGAAVPDGIDTVVMQEHVEVDQQSITVDHRHQAGQNIRMAGEDLRAGEIILQAGRLLTPADIGLMASLGLHEVKVIRKLTVAITSTGNEVLSIGQTKTDTGIYDSNRYSLMAALDRKDIEIINLGIIEDSPQALLACFNQASQYADVIISSGGVSVGDADHTKTALQQSGNVNFWKIAIKPGRPLAFGKIGNSVFFGLPGNPVAVMVTFYLFVLPALEYMLGIKDKPVNPKIKVKSLQNIRKKPGRTEIVRGILEQDNDGSWQVKTTGKQGSGILRSMSMANAFIILEHDRESVKAGEWVTVQAFAGLF